MTKAEIRAMAKNVEAMDILNTISGLLEVNNESDQDLINQLIDDVYKKINLLKIVSINPSQKTKNYMLEEIAKVKGAEFAQMLSKKRFLEIRLAYMDLTKE